MSIKSVCPGKSNNNARTHTLRFMHTLLVLSAFNITQTFFKVRGHISSCWTFLMLYACNFECVWFTYSASYAIHSLWAVRGLIKESLLFYYRFCSSLHFHLLIDHSCVSHGTLPSNFLLQSFPWKLFVCAIFQWPHTMLPFAVEAENSFTWKTICLWHDGNCSWKSLP